MLRTLGSGCSRVGDVHVPARAHGDPRRIGHLTVVRAGAPPLIDVTPGGVELLDPLIGRVRDVQVPVGTKREGAGVVQLPVRVARPAELRQEGAVRVELLDLDRSPSS